MKIGCERGPLCLPHSKPKGWSREPERSFLTPASVTQAAQLLLRARHTDIPLESLPTESRPTDMAAGYAIQRMAARLRGLDIAGFKVGLTNLRAQRAAGTTEPIVGRLAAADIRRSPARLHVAKRRIVEAEVIFEVAHDLPTGQAPFTSEQVAEALGAAYAGIEVCASRFTSDDLPIAHVISDNSNAEFLVVGEALPSSFIARLIDLPVTLSRRGQDQVQGSTANVLGQPLLSVTWLAIWLAREGEGLKRGQLIASGSCTGMVEAATDDLVVARFGSYAQAIVEFAPKSTDPEGTS
jgi:2-keto-4-pentenoate hydratase